MKNLFTALICFLSVSVFAGFDEMPNQEQLLEIKSTLPYDSDCIMAKYTSVHVPSQNKTYYEAFFWNTKNGESILYFYSYTNKKFQAYGDDAQLPSNPLNKAPAGKIMADYTSVHVPSEDKTYYEVLFWDTKTGTSVLYYYNYDDKGFVAYSTNVQISANPLGSDVEGTVMADYESVHVPSEDKTYYEVLFWDTKTGKSKLYFYSYDSKNFKPYEDNVQLPGAPLDFEPQGDVMVDYTSIHDATADKTYYEALFWDTESGNSNFYYYNYDDKKFKEYGEGVQLPNSPFENPQGKIMADYNAVEAKSENKIYYEVLFWDTETGESKLYYYNSTDKGFKLYGDNVQFPSDPLNGLAEGTIMANYTAVYSVQEDKTYYEALFWDVKTGYSRLYYYNMTDKVFKAYGEEAQLPEVGL